MHIVYTKQSGRKNLNRLAPKYSSRFPKWIVRETVQARVIK